MDDADLRILYWLQRDASMPLTELAEKTGLSPSPCWRRVQRMTAEGVIRARVALLDAERINVGVNVFVSVRTSQHKKEWVDAFSACVMALPEVVGFYRMAGDVDYLLHIVVPDIAGYDRVYNGSSSGSNCMMSAPASRWRPSSPPRRCRWITCGDQRPSSSAR